MALGRSRENHLQVSEGMTSPCPCPALRHFLYRILRWWQGIMTLCELKMCETGRKRRGRYHKVYIFLSSINRRVDIVRSVCLSVGLAITLTVCLTVCLSNSLSVYLLPIIYTSVCLSVTLSVCLTVCPSVFLSVSLSGCMSVSLSVHLYKYLYLRNYYN